MILNSAKYSDYLKMLHYGKTKGMILTEKLFPKYSVYDKLILFQTEEEFLSIQEECKDVFFLRADNVIGATPIPKALKGRNATKETAISFIREVKQANPEFSIVYMEEDDRFLDPIHLIYTHGAFNLYFYWGNMLYIDYVCPFFDASNLTKGQAVHESFQVPFSEIYYLDAQTIRKFQTKQVSSQNFQEQWQRRKLELLKEHLEYQRLIQTIDPSFTPCPDAILDSVIDSCCFSVLENKHHILPKTGNEFGIQLNINRYDEIEIYEISRLERMIKR